MSPDAAPAPSSEASRAYPGWRVVFACFLMATMSWGLGFYGLAVYLSELRKAHGWPAGLVSTAITAYYFAGALMLPFVADVMDRAGPRIVTLVGIALMAGSSLALTTIDQPWQLYAALAPMALGWVATSLTAINITLGLWFVERRGMAISFALNGASVAGMLVLPALATLTEALGFGGGQLVAVAAMLAIVIPAILIWIDRPPPAILAARPPSSGPRAGPWTRARALRSWHFWSVAAPFSLALLAQVGFIVHQVSVLEQSMSRTLTGLAIGFGSAMAVVGRITLGMFVDRLDQRVATACCLVSQAIALAAIAAFPAPAMLFVACAVFGFSVGSIITLPSVIVQREFGTAAFATLIALLASINQISYAFGAGLLGWVRDWSGGYGASLAVCIAAELLAATLILMRPAKTG